MGWIRNAISTLKWLELAKFVWDLVVFVTSLGLVKKALSYIPQISSDWAWLIALATAAGVLYMLIRSQEKKSQSQQSTQNASTSLVTPPTGDFDAKEFFRLAYYSPLQADAERNLHAAAIKYQPNDKMGFYSKLIGVGVIMYAYDLIWWVIFKSQLLALLELNRRGGLLPLSEMKKFYDEAVKTHPQVYANRTFDKWLEYLIETVLILKHPSDMIEITNKGKDFLKYLLHWGREPNQRSL